MPDPAAAIDHVAKITKLAHEADDADTVAHAAHERRDLAIRDAVNDGWSPLTLKRAGVPLSTTTIYRVVGTI